MKTLKCKDLGGPCSEELSAESWDEMVSVMSEHVMDNHPETAKEMVEMHSRDPKEWSRNYKPKWDSAPDDEDRM